MHHLHISDQYLYLDLNELRDLDEKKIIDSELLTEFIAYHLAVIKEKDPYLYHSLPYVTTSEVISLIQALIGRKSTSKDVKTLLEKDHDRVALINYFHSLHSFWCEMNKYGLSDHQPLDLRTNQKIDDLVNRLSQRIIAKLEMKPCSVIKTRYSGLNINLSTLHHSFTNSESYQGIQNFKFVNEIKVNTPFIIFSKSNKRAGAFKEAVTNPLDSIHLDINEFIVIPLMVGRYLAFTYVHLSFLDNVSGLVNLFKVVSVNDIKHRKPDLIYFYGVSEESLDGVYYHDVKENLYLGFVSRNPKNDYFGYVKKMLLTMHNLKNLDNNNLPVHASMISLKYKNGKTKNVAFLGDSGVGKSELLEAFRMIKSDLLEGYQVIFDDMGIFQISDHGVLASGTEIGAFVRLDYLEPSYLYQKLDQVIVYNPHLPNARLVLTINDYETIIRDYPLDILFYANNYEDNEQAFRLIDDKDEAIHLFIDAKRLAKTTTSESGLVSTFFGNPFGPLQRKELASSLIHNLFDVCYANHILVGEIYTKLCVDGKEKSGYLETIKELITSINKLD